MTKLQRQIGVGGAVVAVLLLLYPPWRVEYEGGASLTAYAFAFSPPNEYRRQEGNRSIPPLATAVAAGTLLGELAAVAVVGGFLLWLFRPAGTTPPTAPDTTPAGPSLRTVARESGDGGGGHAEPDAAANPDH
jgi:hypothetical protein